MTENFNCPLPNKSEFSFVATRDSHVLGFWIASERISGEAHTHRVAVESSWRSGEISRRLFCAFWRAAIVQPSIWRMTVEVSLGNMRARKFYSSIGYRLTGPQETKAYLKARGRDEATDGIEIISAGGTRSIVMIRPIEKDD